MSLQLSAWLRRFRPAPLAIGRLERVRVSIGALLGVGITGAVMCLLLPQAVGAMPWLVGPIGASAVLLFALPSSPLAQPWPVLGGNTLSALVGVLCARWIDPVWLAAAAAVAGAIALMLALRCLHPPGGAMALTAVLGGPAIDAAGFGFIVAPVALNSALLLATALLFHNATRHSYPRAMEQAAAAPPAAAAGELGVTAEDLDFALEGQNDLLDIGREDLEALLHRAERHAWRRRIGGLSCADLVTKPVSAVNYGTHLEEAWHLLQRNGLKALPVIDGSRRVIGIVTAADFMKHAGVDGHESLARRLRRFVRRIHTVTADRPEVVGQIMNAPVQTISCAASVIDLVPLFAASGHRQIPIVDDEHRLFGMLSQFDLISALYNQGLQAA
jgi:CBS domain-containing membrane protein